MRWMRSAVGPVLAGVGLLLLNAACRGTAETAPGTGGRNGHVTDGGSAAAFQDVRRWDAGVQARQRPPPAPAQSPDGGACPGRQQPCCDGTCGTELQCAQLACDPAPHRLPPPAEER